MNTVDGQQSTDFKNIDLFALANTALFLLACVFTYYDRFLQYRGHGNLHEFLIYGAAIVAAIALLWSSFRQHEFKSTLLLLLQLGILAHFSGAFIVLDGSRLYDHVFFGLRYDKYVHFINAYTGCLLVFAIFRSRGLTCGGFALSLTILTVLGLGAIVEIIEYGVVRTVAHTGVGDYDNNMQDLIANLAGCVFCVLSSKAKALYDQTRDQAIACIGASEEQS